jgi:hypothetical protein
MLVRYRATSALTLQNFKDDINGIITGTITAANQLSSPAQANSTVLGNYPSAVYSRVNGTSYTYSKVHNSVGSKTHYFRLTFDSTQLTTFTIAQDYTSGTDTLLNSYAKTINLQKFTYDSTNPQSLDIIINNKGICFLSPYSGVYGGLFDIGHSGVSRTYTSSMLMTYMNFDNVLNNNIDTFLIQNPVFKTTTGGTTPYSYNLDTLSYGSLTYGITTTIPYKRMTTVGGTVSVIENPVFLDCPNSAYATHVLYGVYKLPTNCFSGIQTYVDGSSLYRITFLDFSFLVD